MTVIRIKISVGYSINFDQNNWYFTDRIICRIQPWWLFFAWREMGERAHQHVTCTPVQAFKRVWHHVLLITLICDTWRHTTIGKFMLALVLGLLPLRAMETKAMALTAKVIRLWLLSQSRPLLSSKCHGFGGLALSGSAPSRSPIVSLVSRKCLVKVPQKQSQKICFWYVSRNKGAHIQSCDLQAFSAFEITVVVQFLLY